MKILYLAFVRLPTEKAHGAQIMKTCEAFAKTDSSVELMIPGRKTHIAESPFSYYGVEKNFEITALNTLDWVRWSVFGFVLSAIWFAEVAKWQKSFWVADIIYSRDAFVLLQYILLGRKLVYEAHTKPTLLSKFVARQSHRLVVISEGLRNAYAAVGVDSEKIIVAHDAVDPEPFKKEYNQKESRAWLGIPQNKKVALYVGRIDEAKGADTFAAASEYVTDDWVCVLVGSGELKNELIKKYPKALFLLETPYRELPRVLAAADVLVLPNSAKDETFSEFTSPLKAFAYIAAEKPIISSNVNALKAIFKNEVVYFDAGDSESFVDSLNVQLKIPSLSAHTWDDRAQHILKKLQKVV